MPAGIHRLVGSSVRAKGKEENGERKKGRRGERKKRRGREGREGAKPASTQQAGSWELKDLGDVMAVLTQLCSKVCSPSQGKQRSVSKGTVRKQKSWFRAGEMT